MPQMPTYNSNRELTTQQPSFLATENADAKVAGVASGAVDKTLEMGQKWATAMETIQSTAAKAKRAETNAAIDLQAEADPDPNNFDKYAKQYDQAAVDSVKGMTSGSAQKAELFTAQHEANLAKIKLQGVYKGKILKINQTNALTILDNEVKNPSVDSTAKINAEVEKQVKAGNFDAKAGYELAQKKIKDANWNKFALLAKTDREAAKKLAESGTLNFDSDQADKAMNYLNNLKNIEDKNTMIDKIDNRYNIIDAISTGKEDIFNLSPQAQVLVAKDEVLSAAIAKGQQKGKGYIPETTDAENYIKIFSDASKATNSDSLSALVTDAVYRDKTPTPDKLGLIIFYANQHAKNMNLSEKILEPIGTATTQEQMQATQIDAGMNRIARWSRDWDISVKDHSDTQFDFLRNVKDGMKPLEALNVAMKNTNLKLHPAMVLYPKEGQMVVDAKGRYAMAYPDGNIVPIGNPTPSKTSSEPKKSTSKELTWENTKRKK